MHVDGLLLSMVRSLKVMIYFSFLLRSIYLSMSLLQMDGIRNAHSISNDGRQWVGFQATALLLRTIVTALRLIAKSERSVLDAEHQDHRQAAPDSASRGPWQVVP